MKHEMAVMDSSGDTKTMWDPDNADEVEMARQQFDTFKKKGYQAFRVKKDGDAADRMDLFDPKAGKIIFIPKIVGG